MLLRFLTSLLVLVILFPSGVFGGVMHRCGMFDRARATTPPCCQGKAYELPSRAGIVQLGHHCQTAMAPVSPVATVNPRLEVDAGAHLAADLPHVPLLRPMALTFQNLLTRTNPHARGGGVPVFLRTCSFLI
jgi:hypothetical protein